MSKQTTSESGCQLSNMAVSSVCQYDFYVISDNAEWENTTILELQKTRPGIQCISRNDWIPGKYKLENLIEPVSTCKIVVVGFSSSSPTGKTNFLAQTVVEEILENNNIEEGKLIPVRIAKDAKIPKCLNVLTPANGWEDNVYEKLLHVLDGAKLKLKIHKKQSGDQTYNDVRTNVVQRLINLSENIDGEMLEKISDFLSKIEIEMQFAKDGSIIFYLSVYNPKALTNLWKIHASGQLIKDFGKILIPEELQKVFLDNWITEIDEAEYKSALDMLNEKEHGKPIRHTDAFQTFKQTLVTLEISAQHFINKLEDSLKALMENATKLEKNKDKCWRDIEYQMEEMYQKVKENGDKLKNEVEAMYKMKKKINDEQIDELKTTISDTNTNLSLINQLLVSDDGTAMQSSEPVIKALKDRINKLPETEPIDNGEIYFFRNEEQMFSIKHFDIGTVKQLKPIKQSPMIIKAKKGRLVNTLRVKTLCTDVVKCENDSLLVSSWTNKMLKYKESGEYIGKVTLPQDVKVWRMYKMKNGNIACSDDENKSIKICNMNFQVIKTIGEGVLKSICGIHVNETSNILYVAGGLSNCVYMFDMNNGQTIKKIGSKDTKEGQVYFVSDVTLTNQGHLLVLACGNSRLQLFDNEGKFMRVLVEAGKENGKLRYPEAVVVDKDDNIIISSRHKLQLFNRDGNFIKRIDKPDDGIHKPRGLSIISYHPRRLAVANAGDKTVKIFNY